MDMEKWNKFTRTGSIFDYLEYSACASDDDEQQSDNSDGNRTERNAGRGLQQKSDDSYKGTR